MSMGRMSLRQPLTVSGESSGIVLCGTDDFLLWYCTSSIRNLRCPEPSCSQQLPCEFRPISSFTDTTRGTSPWRSAARGSVLFPTPAPCVEGTMLPSPHGSQTVACKTAAAAAAAATAVSWPVSTALAQQNERGASTPKRTFTRRTDAGAERRQLRKEV